MSQVTRKPPIDFVGLPSPILKKLLNITGIDFSNYKLSLKDYELLTTIQSHDPRCSYFSLNASARGYYFSRVEDNVHPAENNEAPVVPAEGEKSCSSSIVITLDTGVPRVIETRECFVTKVLPDGSSLMFQDESTEKTRELSKDRMDDIYRMLQGFKYCSGIQSQSN